MRKFNFGATINLGLNNHSNKWSNGLELWLQTGQGTEIKTWFNLSIRGWSCYIHSELFPQHEIKGGRAPTKGYWLYNFNH